MPSAGGQVWLHHVGADTSTTNDLLLVHKSVSGLQCQRLRYSPTVDQIVAKSSLTNGTTGLVSLSPDPGTGLWNWAWLQVNTKTKGSFTGLSNGSFSPDGTGVAFNGQKNDAKGTTWVLKCPSAGGTYVTVSGYPTTSTAYRDICAVLGGLACPDLVAVAVRLCSRPSLSPSPRDEHGVTR